MKDPLLKSTKRQDPVENGLILGLGLDIIRDKRRLEYEEKKVCAQIDT